MSWLGKLLGGGLGFIVGGPIGLVLGAVAGHHTLDASGTRPGLFSRLEQKQSIYFAATFSMLAKLAKADGVISQQEIDVIDRVMTENLRLDPAARKLAIEIFNEAKDSSQQFEDYARQFQEEFGKAEVATVSLIDLLLLVAHADGEMDSREETMILSAVKIFGLDGRYRELKSRFVGIPDDIEHCYRLLGAERGDPQAEIKKKYRRLAMEHHPDRAAANGVTPELVSAAEARFKEIQHAYDMVEKDLANAR